MIKKGQIFLVFGVVIVILVLFIIAFLIYTYPRVPYDYSCIVDEDCVLKDVGSGCPWNVCINKAQFNETNLAKSREGIPKSKGILSPGCIPSEVLGCKCRNNLCEGINIAKPEFAEDCNYIEMIQWRDVCYINYAKNHSDSQACEQIHYPDREKKCEEFMYTYCDSDDDCVLEIYLENNCCLIPCRNHAVNKQTQERRAKWRETHCTQEERELVENKIPSKLTKEDTNKWSCLFENVECDPSYYEEAYCDNGTCKSR